MKKLSVMVLCGLAILALAASPSFAEDAGNILPSAENALTVTPPSADAGGAFTQVSTPGVGAEFTLTPSAAGILTPLPAANVLIPDGAGGSAGSLTKDGVGTSTLSGANICTGVTTVSVGAATVGAGQMTITGTGTLNLVGVTLPSNVWIDPRITVVIAPSATPNVAGTVNIPGTSSPIPFYRGTDGPVINSYRDSPPSTVTIEGPTETIPMPLQVNHLDASGQIPPVTPHPELLIPTGKEPYTTRELPSGVLPVVQPIKDDPLPVQPAAPFVPVNIPVGATMVTTATIQSVAQAMNVEGLQSANGAVQNFDGTIRFQ